MCVCVSFRGFQTYSHVAGDDEMRAAAVLTRVTNLLLPSPPRIWRGVWRAEENWVNCEAETHVSAVAAANFISFRLRFAPRVFAPDQPGHTFVLGSSAPGSRWCISGLEQRYGLTFFPSLSLEGSRDFRGRRRRPSADRLFLCNGRSARTRDRNVASV